MNNVRMETAVSEEDGSFDWRIVREHFDSPKDLEEALFLNHKQGRMKVCSRRGEVPQDGEQNRRAEGQKRLETSKRFS